MKISRCLLTLCGILFCVIAANAATIIVDAGHGGVDGGAVSPNGTVESPLNLSIAGKIEELFTFFGENTLMTRESEEIIYPPQCQSIRKKKIYDTNSRTELVNQQENAVMISIHQNSLPSSPQTHGAVVFYNKESGAEEIGERIQSTLNQVINTENEKEARQISKDIYLMNHCHHPAVLVECGFLSNREDEKNLQDPEYQKIITAAVVCGYLQQEAVP